METEVKRNIKKEGNIFLVEITGTSKLNEEEFKRVFLNKSTELNNLEAERSTLVEELKKLNDKVDFDPELLALKEKLDKINEIRKVQDLKEEIKIKDKKKLELEREVKDLHTYAKNL